MLNKFQFLHEIQPQIVQIDAKIKYHINLRYVVLCACDQVLCQLSTSNVAFHLRNHVIVRESARMCCDGIE